MLVLRNISLPIMISFILVACGGGGGSSAPDVTAGPPIANQPQPDPTPITPPAQPNTYARASTASATITGVRLGQEDQVDFTLVDGDGVALTGLTSANVRFHIAKLIPAANGDSAYWLSYINRRKTPAVVSANPPAIQATSERGGNLEDHGDGTYTYSFIADIENISEPTPVAFEPTLPHRVGIQFSGGFPINPTYDWLPSNNATAGLNQLDVAATETCNTCHNPLAIHGGGRLEMDLCVMCHNPGTHEPNSDESMDMKVLIHRIHLGADLPSVKAGNAFVVYGYRDSLHDYSSVVLPQSPANCAKCHTGSATVDQPVTASTVTDQGDNWHQFPTMEACGSCHDDLDFTTHAGGQANNEGCRSCHNPNGIAGSVIDNHANTALQRLGDISVVINSVSDTSPGQRPTVNFSMTNPTSGEGYDILNDAQWQTGRLRLGIAWNTREFTNTGAQGTGKPFYMRTDALTLATQNTDGSYQLTAADPIPDGSAAPFRSATGTGMAIFEGRMNAETGRVPFKTEPFYFPITDAEPVARTRIVGEEKCNACHAVMRFHGDLRTNTEAGCQGCHHPRIATDAGESIDMKRMIHGIHAAAVRTNPLVIRGTPFDTDVVQFPGELADCRTCHINDSYQLPVRPSLLAVTTNMGADLADPADDTMITPQAATCTGCHDSDVAKAHMEQNGADFSITEATLGSTTETCEICHSSGSNAAIKTVHGITDD